MKIIGFIELFRDQFRVEPICVTQATTECGFITARAYRAAKNRPASVRSIKDELLVGDVQRIQGENYSVYGVRKMHSAMNQASWDVGRDPTGRLMR